MKPGSVQTARLGLRDIQTGVVDLGEGEYRAILDVTGTTTPWEDDARQEAVLAGFGTVLNGLGFPIQILVRATPIDLTRYVAVLDERARQALPGQLAGLAQDHAAFLLGLARQRTLLERRFYVVVPAASRARSGWRWFQPRQTLHAAAEAEAAARQLTLRCDDLARQLARCNLAIRRLGDAELAHLYFACWSPERARVQRFRQRLADYATLAVRGPANAAPETGGA